MTQATAKRMADPVVSAPPFGAPRRFVFLLVGLQLLLAVVVVGGAVHNAMRMRQEALQDHLRHATALVRGVEDQLTQSLYLASLTLANLPDVVGFDSSAKPLRHNAALEKIQRQMPALRSLSLADRTGHIRASSVAANVGRQVDLSPLLPLATPEHTALARIGVPWEGRDFHDGRPSTIEQPVGARANTFFPLVLALPDTAGLVAIAAINSDYFINHIGNQINPALTHISVYDYNGTLLLSTLTDHAPGSHIVETELLARVLDREIDQTLDDRAHGMDVLTAFRASRNYPFFVVAHVDKSTALAQWRDETLFILSAIGLALAATLAITGILTLRLRTGLDQEARMQEERRLAFEQSPSSIVITNLEPAIEYVNPKFCQVTGYTPEEVIGQNPRLLQSNLTPPETYRAMWAKLLAGENWEGEFINRRKDGTHYFERATLAPIRDTRGQVARYLAIKHDISEQKRLELAQIEAKNAAEASSRAKSEFLANMSHEIRTPMNGIIGMMQLALESGLKPEQDDLVRKAHGAAISLLGILNDILDFSKIEAGKLEFESRPFDLDEVVAHLRDLFEVAARDKGLEFALSCAPDTPRQLVGDPLRLTQVLNNLVGNAIKFTHAGRVELRIAALATEQDATRLLFEVVDTGIGLSPAQLGRLFQAFRQGDSSTTREYGGTGLGLVISHRLVATMGGRIDVDSAPGAGSRFHFTALFERSTESAHQRALRDHPADLSGLAILLVEDNALNQQLARTFLERAGITVTVADNGAKAIEILDTGNTAFDAVLMDIQMPVMDGLTATRLIRADARHTHLPIIATTAHAMTEDRAECLAAGMQDYLTKPIDVNLLYAKIAQWTGRRDREAVQTAPAPRPTIPSTVAPSDDALAERAIAIERIGGSEEIYREVIATFCTDQGSTIANLRAALAAADIATSHRIAHTLKGTAATIGATGLFEAALALDRDLKAGTLPSDWPARVSKLEARLAATLAAIVTELSSSSPG